MATHPDANPDSLPTGPADSPEQVSPADNPGRENVEDIDRIEDKLGDFA